MSNKIDFDKIGLKNDLMFCTVMVNPEICKEFLQRVLGIQIAEIVIAEEQKSIKSRFHCKGIRLYIYAKDIEGNAYDVEMQIMNTGELPLRSRYYHSEMDSYQINAGQKYSALKKSIVIFICDFDLFEKGLSVYTFNTLCREDHSIQLEDGRTTIFINLNGDRNGLSEELICVLDYIKTSLPRDDYTSRIDKEVKNIRTDTDWRGDYMIWATQLDVKFAEGEQKGMEKGELIGRIKAYSECGLSAEEISKKLNISVEEVEEILNA